ncbi:MAG: CBS domain-containing protein [Erysipelotrichales bacterium]|nr:CBS domain-containing protein [Erysipelotrichales bacterium]
MTNILQLLTPKKFTYYLDENCTIRQALEKFDAHRFSVVPLINDQGKYTGTVSEGDILHYIKNRAHFDVHEAEKVLIKDIEHYRPYRALYSGALLVEVFALSLDQSFIPVVDDRDVFIGIIKRKELLSLLSDQLLPLTKEK